MSGYEVLSNAEALRRAKAWIRVSEHPLIKECRLAHGGDTLARLLLRDGLRCSSKDSHYVWAAGDERNTGGPASKGFEKAALILLAATTIERAQLLATKEAAAAQPSAADERRRAAAAGQQGARNAVTIEQNRDEVEADERQGHLRSQREEEDRIFWKARADARQPGGVLEPEEALEPGEEFDEADGSGAAAPVAASPPPPPPAHAPPPRRVEAVPLPQMQAPDVRSEAGAEDAEASAEAAAPRAEPTPPFGVGSPSHGVASPSADFGFDSPNEASPGWDEPSQWGSVLEPRMQTPSAPVQQGADAAEGGGALRAAPRQKSALAGYGRGVGRDSPWPGPPQACGMRRDTTRTASCRTQARGSSRRMPRMPHSSCSRSGRTNNCCSSRSRSSSCSSRTSRTSS